MSLTDQITKITHLYLYYLPSNMSTRGMMVLYSEQLWPCITSVILLIESLQLLIRAKQLTNKGTKRTKQVK